MDLEESYNEEIVLLDFGDKLPKEILQNKMFVRITNLEDKNPLIQVNDLIFKGTYDYSVGTNLIFKKSPNNSPMEFPFAEASPFKLDFLHSQTKIVNCKQQKVPSATTVQLPSNLDNIKFNLNWDYKEILKKFEDGTLDLNDMICREENEIVADQIIDEDKIEINEEELEELPQENELIPIDRIKPDISELNNIHQNPISHENDELLAAYNNLLMLAKTPLRSKKLEDEKSSCMPEFKYEYDYKSIECKVLQRPWFAYFKPKFNGTKIEDSIDIEKCVSMGLIENRDFNSTSLSEEEKKKLLIIDNFEILDLPARFLVMNSYLEELEKQIISNTTEENSILDEYQRTPLDTLKIFQRLVTALKKRVNELNSM